MRQLADIQKDYGDFCVKYGDLSMKIVRLKNELKVIEESILNLDKEYQELMAHENTQETKAP